MKNNQSKVIPRGIRNNNPGNIRNSNERWQGEVQPSGDGSFKQFESMAYGYRAMIKLIQNYYKLYNCNTLGRIIRRYAPPNENNTDNYIKVVSVLAKIDPDQHINIYEKDIVTRIVSAMSLMENGVEADMKEIYKGWNLL